MIYKNTYWKDSNKNIYYVIAIGYDEEDKKVVICKDVETERIYTISYKNFKSNYSIVNVNNSVKAKKHQMNNSIQFYNDCMNPIYFNTDIKIETDFIEDIK